MVHSAASAICGAPIGLGSAQASVLIGLDAQPICVEVCCTRGPAFFQLVGLPEAAVREAKVRIAAALARIGILLDEYALTVNLAPADMRKAGAALDLAICAAVLAAIRIVPNTPLEGCLVIGELGLDGRVRQVRGLLPQLDGAARRGIPAAIVPAGNAAEAGLASGITTYLASTLQDLVEHCQGKRTLPHVNPTLFLPVAFTGGDLAEVRGQTTARRALEIAATGNHNLLMMGPPGSGKTMLARLLPTLLPPLALGEAIECTKIHSIAGTLPEGLGIVQKRPFRAPHHSVSEAGLVGGGEFPKPGEVSLAHHGVLFLDELAEFRRNALEALRQPLEDGLVCIARARARAWFPARPLVVGAANPCPCGYAGHSRRLCHCNPQHRQRYQARMSGPLLDRLDIHVSVPQVEVSALTKNASGESSAVVRARVDAARARQSARARQLRLSAETNGRLHAGEVAQVAEPDAEGRHLLEAAANQMGLSARSYSKVLRVARTIADLDASDHVRAPHVAEAVQGRLFDTDNWRG